MGQAITVRKLKAADAAEYRQFRLCALRDSPTAFTSSFAEEAAKPLRVTVERLEPAGRPHDAVFGAVDGAGTLVGTAGLAVYPSAHERHKGRLFGMAVAQPVTGRGIGRLLVRHVLDNAAAIDGLLQVGLTVSEGNRPAERLYQSCGFEVWGREPRAIVVAGEPVAKLHMVHTLLSGRHSRRESGFGRVPLDHDPGEFNP
jgi:RimJ/RimL family protein N-acetyltransferase